MAHKEIKAVQRLIRLEADAEGNLQVPDRIQLMSAGHWHTPWHGAFEMTPLDLADMVIHFEEGVGQVNASKKLPINFGHDISGKAAGWIVGLELDNNGTELWGSIEWTPYGKQMLADAEFRYISPEWNPRDWPWENPEVEGEFIENVLTGAGLTNIPLFKGLTPIMASADTGNRDNKLKQTQGGDMTLTLDEVRGKKKEDLTNEESAFLEEHKTELTDDERTTFGLTVEGGDGEGQGAGEGEGSNGAGEGEGEGAGSEGQGQGGQQASAIHGYTPEKLQQLEADAAAGRAASNQLLKTSIQASVDKAVERGAVKSEHAAKAVDMLFKADTSTRASMLDFISKLPENKLAKGEIGDGGGGVQASAQEELNTLAADVVAKSGGATSYGDAVTGIMASNTDLAKRVRAERQA